MARRLYGASPADYVVNTTTGAPRSGVTVTIYTASSGGSQVTDLQNMSFQAISTVTSDANGGFRFYGPDGTDATLWASTGGGSRYAVNCADLGATRAPLSHSHDSAQFSSGTLLYSAMTPGTVITVDKVKNGNSWPGSRPTARTDVTVHWVGDTDPGGIAINGDVWYDL